MFELKSDFIWCIRFKYKVQEFYRLKNMTETLVLGSSYAFYGYRAQKGEFNFGEPSQDLYYSFEIYKKFSDMPNLKNVVLFYGVFSPGHILEKTKLNTSCEFYKKFLSIPYRYNKYDSGITEKFLICDHFLFHKKFHKNMYGNAVEYLNANIKGEEVKERVAGHLKNNRRQNNQTAFVEKCASLARQKNHAFYIVLPPFRSDYTRLLPPFDEVFAPLISLLKTDKSVHFLNYLGDADFCDEDFFDPDHLNLNGARKLTPKIRSKLTAPV